MSASVRRPFELRGIHVLLVMLAFFAAIIAVNIAFAVAAVRSFPGEDVRHSYLQGLRYNDTLAERHAQAALGWRVTAALNHVGDAAMVEVTLAGRDGRPITGAVVVGELERPTDSRLDHALAFSAAGDGRYSARLSELAPGRWRLRAHAMAVSGDVLDFNSELTWRASR
jgi:nitrogen fixation protein FixH